MPNKIKKILSFLTLSFLFVPLSIAGVCISGSNVFDTKCSGYGASTLTQTLLNYGNATFIKNFAGVPVGTSGSLNADYSAGSGTATFTATRSSTTPATYVDANGVIQLTTTSNVPRITSGFYDSTGFVSRPGLIVEGASTNLGQDAYFSQTYATYWRVNGTPSSNGTSSDYINPYLGGVVGKFISSAQNDGIQCAAAKQVSVTSGTTYTVSALVRGTGTAKAFFYDGTSKIGTAITLSSSSWKLVRLSAAATATTGANFGVVADDGSSTVYIAYIQMEALPFASTFIPTTTAALTRNAETLTYPISGNRTAATESVFVKFTPFWAGTAITSDAFLSSTDTSQRRLYAGLSTTDKSAFQARGGVTTVVNATSSITAGTSYIVAGVSQTTGNPNESIFFNGTSEGSDGTDFAANPWGTNFSVGSSEVPGNQLHGIIQSLAIFSDAKSAADVSNISATLRN